MSLLHNNEILGGTTIDCAGRTFTSHDAMRDFRVSGLGQVTDATTGITGSSGRVALEKARAQGLSGASLDAFIDRIGGKR